MTDKPTEAKLAEWLAGWLEVRHELEALIDQKAATDPRFYRRYDEMDLEDVDRALVRLGDMAKRLTARSLN